MEGKNMKNFNNINNTENVTENSKGGRKTMKNYIALTIRRLMSVFVPVSGKESDRAQTVPMVAAMAKNVQALGFAFSADLTAALAAQAPEFLKGFYTELIQALRVLIGADKEFSPFYPNFPAQVAEASDAELFINAVIHYATFGTVVPDYPKDERFPLVGETPLKEIRLLQSEKDVMAIFTNLLSSSVPLSEQDKEDVKWFVENADYASFVPEEIPMKETKAFFGMLLLERGDAETAKALYRTATDVLRLIAAMSGEDVSLSSRIKVRKMKRSERRFIMDLLAGCGSVLEDMFRNRALWVIVGEIVHPGEFAGRNAYAQVVAAFDRIRKDDKPLFFAGQVEAAVKTGDWRRAVELLKTRPGEFARMLDRILRIEGADAEAVVAEFGQVAGQVSTRVLWQAKSHFDHRGEQDARAFFPKGNEAKCRLVKNELADLPKDVCEKASEACLKGILEQYAQKPAMGTVFVDPEFRHYAAPFTQRASSAGFMQVARGSRLPLSADCSVVRPFIWWTNMESGERVDVDLAVSFLSENWEFKGEVSYCSVRNERLKAYHSGDFTNGGKFGGKGVSEFVDFSPKFLLEQGVRYACVQVHMYSMQPFCELPCFFGWMERSDAQSGEVFEPRTVRNRIALTVNATSAIPAIIDCLTGEVVWADMTARSGVRFGGNNVYSNMDATFATVWAIVNWEKPSLYDVVRANAEARGTLTDDRKAADVIFSNDPTRPLVKIVEKDENGRESVKEVEKAVAVRDAFDLAFYMGEML